MALFTENLTLSSPSTFLLSGCTGSGKTFFIMKMIANSSQMFEHSPEKIYYFYSIWQPIFDRFHTENKVTFISGLPNEEKIKEIANEKHNLIIIDDMQINALNDSFISNLFSRESHHRNLTIFLLLQNLFHQGKYGRDISLNTHHLILFRNLRDINQIKYLSRQIGLWKKLEYAYKDVLNIPYNYLLIDLSPKSNPNIMLRSNIFPGENAIICK